MYMHNQEQGRTKKEWVRKRPRSSETYEEIMKND